MSKHDSIRCLIVDDDAFSRAVLEQFVERHPALMLVDSKPSAIEGASRLQEGDVDLLFLDIEMEEMTGLELVVSLENPPQIVLVSSKQEYAVDAFDIEVADYLLKPITYSRFLRGVNRALKAKGEQARQVSHGEDPFVFVKTEGRLVKIDLRAIRWVEAQADYAMIDLGTDKFLVHGTMKSFASRLPDRDFTRVHRSFIVRIDQIDDLTENSLVIDRKVIPIGATYRESLLERLRTL